MKRAPVIVSAICIICATGAFVQWLNLQSGAKAIAELASYDVRDGKREAQDDLARGILKWKVAGLVHDYQARSSNLRAKLGTQLDWFGGCEGSAARDRYIFTYNSTVWNHLATLFDQGLMREVLGAPPELPRDDQRG